MNIFSIGDIVVRKSYKGDMYFKIVDIKNERYAQPIYVLKGMLHRLEADSDGSDLVKQDHNIAHQNIKRECMSARRYANRSVSSLFSMFSFNKFRAKSGRILHVDSSKEFLELCLNHYKDAKLEAAGKLISESEQPYYIRQLLVQNKPDIVVITGHDSLKKGSGNLNSIDNYSNSKYYIQSVKEARKYEPDNNKLCIFAGACQSYYELIMDAGANFASSPGRVLINALDPAFVSEKVASTDSKLFVSPKDIVATIKSGSKGIWGINTRGHLVR
jgi:spore coat assemly protein